MIALTTFLIVILLSIIVTRVGTVALTQTGMTRESARFQARSAFSGTGFTTKEAETVVNHPARRKIVMALMLLGNAGLVAAISSFVLTFVEKGSSSGFSIRLGIILGGLVLLWLFSINKWVDRGLSRIIDRLLRRYTELDVTDYASLLHVSGAYRLAKLKIAGDDWLDGMTLADARLRHEGIVVLGIEKSDGSYVGNPRGAAKLHSEDTLIIYGDIANIRGLDRRRKGHTGDREHERAVQGQEQVLAKEAVNPSDSAAD